MILSRCPLTSTHMLCDRQTERQTDRQTHRQTEMGCSKDNFNREHSEYAEVVLLVATVEDLSVESPRTGLYRGLNNDTCSNSLVSYTGDRVSLHNPEIQKKKERRVSPYISGVKEIK